MRAMFRYQVPVDDEPHLFTLTGDPVAVAPLWAGTGSEPLMAVDFWAEHAEHAGRCDRVFQVFGTGQPLPADARWVGTCPRIAGLVWHLYERDVDATEPAGPDVGTGQGGGAPGPQIGAESREGFPP